LCILCHKKFHFFVILEDGNMLVLGLQHQAGQGIHSFLSGSPLNSWAALVQIKVVYVKT